jgi:hypothetical protein
MTEFYTDTGRKTVAFYGHQVERELYSSLPEAEKLLYLLNITELAKRMRRECWPNGSEMFYLDNKPLLKVGGLEVSDTEVKFEITKYQEKE